MKTKTEVEEVRGEMFYFLYWCFLCFQSCVLTFPARLPGQHQARTRQTLRPTETGTEPGLALAAV